MGTADKTLTCRDCGTAFTFTVRDQEFFASKGYNPPTRCPSCRKMRKGDAPRERGQEKWKAGGGHTAPKMCPVCKGAKELSCNQPSCMGTGFIQCFACDGTGVKQYVNSRMTKSGYQTLYTLGPCNKCRENGYGEPTGRLQCNRCEGTGNVVCRRCNGTGIYTPKNG